MNNENNLDYDELKDRVIDWCTKLYQDGVYSYNQYQECLKNLDTGTSDSYKSDDINVDEGKDTEKIYGYYKKGKEKLNDSTSNPINPIVKDDFEVMSLYHYKKQKFMISDESGYVVLSINPDKEEDKDWQLVSLGKEDEENVYAIRSRYGNFLLGSDDGTVNAANNIISTWCQWKLIKHNDNFAFKSIVHKKYLSIINDELILVYGWSDNNFWVMNKKNLSEKKHMLKFDNSALILKKNKLLNNLNNYYTNAIGHKYKRDYYKIKLDEISNLRKQQLDYLLQYSNQKLNYLLEDSNKNLEESQTDGNDDENDDENNINPDINNINPESDSDIMKEISDLNLFNDQIKNDFSNLIEQKIQELNTIINNNESKRLDFINQFRESEGETDTFINVLINLNKNTEKNVQKLINGLDGKLEKNIQLSLKLSQNEPNKSFEDLTENVNTNFNMIKTSLASEKRNFFIGIVIICFILLLFYYIIKKNI